MSAQAPASVLLVPAFGCSDGSSSSSEGLAAHSSSSWRYRQGSTEGWWAREPKESSLPPLRPMPPLLLLLPGS
eukprot:1158508-Pelagomonas_calceolata.AAC.29